MTTIMDGHKLYYLSTVSDGTLINATPSLNAPARSEEIVPPPLWTGCVDKRVKDAQRAINEQHIKDLQQQVVMGRAFGSAAAAIGGESQ